jgi:hypothetical protein
MNKKPSMFYEIQKKEYFLLTYEILKKEKFFGFK